MRYRNSSFKLRWQRGWPFLLLVFLVNYFWLPDKWIVLDFGIRGYFTVLTSYAFKKTRICPLEIMRRTTLLKWPRAFRLMYREHARRMMILYFSCGGIVVAKTVFVLYKIVEKWIS